MADADEAFRECQKQGVFLGIPRRSSAVLGGGVGLRKDPPVGDPPRPAAHHCPPPPLHLRAVQTMIKSKDPRFWVHSALVREKPKINRSECALAQGRPGLPSSPNARATDLAFSTSLFFRAFWVFSFLFSKGGPRAVIEWEKSEKSKPHFFELVETMFQTMCQKWSWLVFAKILGRHFFLAQAEKILPE